MKFRVKSLILVAFVASCLIVAPVFSASWGDGHHVWIQESKFNAPYGNNSSVPITVESQREGSGFAISDSQYHVLDLKLESAASFDLAKIKGLVSDNKTLKQIKSDIKSEINAEEAAGTHNGSLRLGEERYKLISAKVNTSQDDNTTVDADVAGPITGLNDNNTNATTVAGHITLTIGEHEKSLIGKGQLTMNSGNYSGTYSVLLNMEPDRGNMKERCLFMARGNPSAGQRFEKFMVERRG